MSEFIQRRLAQLPSVGAALGYYAVKDGYKQSIVFISTVRLAGLTYTRVANREGQILAHYEGDLSTKQAADRYYGIGTATEVA